jgi:hypothetical protein
MTPFINIWSSIGPVVSFDQEVSPVSHDEETRGIH